MSDSKFTLAMLAEIGALRNLVLHAIALRLAEEPAPIALLDAMSSQLTARPTEPGRTTDAPLDPAMSDYLAALTDERLQGLVDDLRLRLGAVAG